MYMIPAQPCCWTAHNPKTPMSPFGNLYPHQLLNPGVLWSVRHCENRSFWKCYMPGKIWLWCWRRLLKSPVDYKEIKPVNPKGNQSWIFIERTDTEAEAPILWPPDEKSWIIRKDPDNRKDWGQEEKGTTEDEMVGWHHWLNGHELAQAPGDGEGQGSLACSSPWGHKESEMT